MFKKSPALFLLIFVVAGVLIADYFRIQVSYFFFALILFIVISFFCLKSQKDKLVVVCLGLSLLSFVGLRFASLYYEIGSNHIANYIDNKTSYVIYGKVSDWPDLKLDRTELTVEVDSLESNAVHYVRGKILLKINTQSTQFQRGDNLVFQGRIYSVEGERFSKEFNYSRFLKYKEISGIVFQTTALNILHDKANRYSIIPFVDQLRNSIKMSLKRNLSPVSSALASGFLIGETRDIPPDLYERFKDSGTLHLLAVSGSNVILVITFFNFLFKPILLTRKKHFLILISVVVLFSLLSYGEPSVMRASLMATLVLLAGIVERRYELKNIIAVAALIILLYEPSQLFDLGFQLSFVIAWALILVLPKLNQLFEKHKSKKWYIFFLLPFLISLIAQIFSIGLIGLYFKQIPLLSPLANLFVVPLVSIAVIGVLVLLVADLILPLFGMLIGSLLNLVLEVTVYFVEFFSSESMPFLSVYDWTIMGVLGVYILLFMIPFTLFSKENRRFFVFTLFLFVNIFAVKSAIALINRTDSLDIICFAIPGGNMAIVKTSEGEVDVIINGIRGKTYNIDEKIMTPKFKNEKVSKIDKLIILKSDFSAIDDLLRLTEKYKVNTIYVPNELIHSFEDQIQNLQINFLPSKLELFQKGTFDKNKQGYVLQDDGFSLVFKNHYITFVDKVLPASLQTLSSEFKHYLIIGSNWNLSINDYLKFNELGYEKIICSKIAQTDMDQKIDFTETTTSLIVDLYKTSEFVLKLAY